MKNIGLFFTKVVQVEWGRFVVAWFHGAIIIVAWFHGANHGGLLLRCVYAEGMATIPITSTLSSLAWRTDADSDLTHRPFVFPNFGSVLEGKWDPENFRKI